jgi:hypothetical protein
MLARTYTLLDAGQRGMSSESGNIRSGKQYLNLDVDKMFVPPVVSIHRFNHMLRSLLMCADASWPLLRTMVRLQRALVRFRILTTLSPLWY